MVVAFAAKLGRRESDCDEDGPPVDLRTLDGFVVAFDATECREEGVDRVEAMAFGFCISFVLAELVISLGADLGVPRIGAWPRLARGFDEVRTRIGAWPRLARGFSSFSSVDVFSLLSTFFPFLLMVKSRFGKKDSS